MAVENTKANAILNADADPPVTNNVVLEHGLMRENAGTVEVAVADDDGSVYRMCRVPSNARISSIQVANDAITGGTDYDIGVYQTQENGGAVVDKDEFASAVDLSSALPFTEYLNEAAAAEHADTEKPLWAKLGLSGDPSVFYDISLTGNTVGGGAGSLSMKLKYVR